MKILKNPKSVFPGLPILLHPNTMCWYFSHSQTFRQLIIIKICALKCLEKIFDFQFHGLVKFLQYKFLTAVVQYRMLDHSSFRDLIRVCTPEQNVDVKSEVVHGFVENTLLWKIITECFCSKNKTIFSDVTSDIIHIL